MHPLRRPTRSTIHYHGRETELGRSLVTFSVNGVQWNYALAPQQCDTVEYLANRVSTGKAFAFAKLHGTGSRVKANTVTDTLLRHRGAQASRAKRIKPGMPNV